MPTGTFPVILAAVRTGDRVKMFAPAARTILYLFGFLDNRDGFFGAVGFGALWALCRRRPLLSEIFSANAITPTV